MYNMAEFIKQKLDAVGMPVELVVSDWATLIKNRANPEMYEVFITGHPSNQHPVLQVFNDKSWPGFWDSAEKDRLIGAMVAEPDPGKQKQLVDEYQGVIWKEMAFIKCGESFGLRAARKEGKGRVSAAETYYWNVALG